MIGNTKLKILQELSIKPSYGYILAKKIEISMSTTYEHLNDLNNNNIINYKKEGKKKIYYLTKKGKAFLKALNMT